MEIEGHVGKSKLLYRLFHIASMLVSSFFKYRMKKLIMNILDNTKQLKNQNIHNWFCIICDYITLD